MDTIRESKNVTRCIFSSYKNSLDGMVYAKRPNCPPTLIEYICYLPATLDAQNVLFLFFFRKIQALLTGPIVTNLVSCSKLYFWSRGPRMPHRAHSERLRFPRPIVLIIVAACGRSSSWSASVERDGSNHGGLLFRTCFPSLLPLFLRTVAVGLISRFCNHFYAWRGHRRVSANKTSYLIKSSIFTLADRAFR